MTKIRNTVFQAERKPIFLIFLFSSFVNCFAIQAIPVSNQDCLATQSKPFSITQSIFNVFRWMQKKARNFKKKFSHQKKKPKIVQKKKINPLLKKV